MKFDSNAAWQQAVALIGSNRAVIWPVAGAFFLIPSLVSVWRFSDVQQAMLANMRDPAAGEAVLASMGGKFALFFLVAIVWQSIGNMALLALYSDRSRPTVGEAIRMGIRSLPAALGAVVLMFLGMFVFMLLAVLVVALLGKVLVALGILAGIAVFALFVAGATRLSLVLPAIVIDGIGNPVKALVRSWRLVTGNTRRLFLFYLLLAIVYFVVALMVQGILIGLFGALFASGGGAQALQSSSFLFALGAISGVIAVAVAVVLNAVFAASYRQLAGDSAERIGQTFA